MREQQVFSAILPCTASIATIRKYEPAGVVLSGGPNSVYDPDAPPCDPAVLSLGLPVLGICYGLQWIAHALGGSVEPRESSRVWPQGVHRKERLSLFAGLPQKLKIWNSHGDHVAVSARRIPHHWRDRSCRLRGRRYDAQSLRGAISSRGAPHRLRHRDPPKLYFSNLPRAAGLERRGVHLRDRGVDSQAGGRQGCGSGAPSGGVDSAVAAVLVQRQRSARN